MKLLGHTALVTGASHGIGRAIALAFAEEGADVAVNYAHDHEAAEAVVSEIASLGRRAIALQADVSDPDEVRRMVERAEAALGPIDRLVNNAGIVMRASLFDITPEMWDRVMDVNAKGVFLVSQAVARGMMARQGGVIVNISSMRGVEGAESSMHYAASKAAVISLTKCFARELAPKVRVNAIAPGYVDTRIQADLSPEKRHAIEQGTPLKRFGQLEDIARTAVYFASDDSAYVTGQTLLVDGGRVIC
ncbi:3-oxoacyl-ACP reductase FabG [bacterium]|nr:3-oxoacyl-ACP reductase FabG [bacterium]